MSIFETLNKINVNDHTEKKNNLTYLSWAFAWGELKKAYPMSYYTIYESENGWNYFTDGHTCWVKTGVTVVDEDGTKLEHIEYLPVMDFKNNSIPAERVTSFDVNKAIQRSLTKAVARHGLGLYIYAGEDLPEEESVSVLCSACGKSIKSVTKRDGSTWPIPEMIKYSTGRYGKPLCGECMKFQQKKEKQQEAMNGV